MWSKFTPGNWWRWLLRQLNPPPAPLEPPRPRCWLPPVPPPPCNRPPPTPPVDVTEALDLWARFTQLHPYRRERFDPTPANVHRWRWHLAHAGKRHQCATYTVPAPPPDWAQLVEKRRVRSFADFPGTTQMVYAEVAAAYPTHQVYACGSRVRGDYVDASDHQRVRFARTAAGMKDKLVSDFDYWVATRVPPRYPLSTHTEQVRGRIPEADKIPLPMWDFSKLPAERHGEVIDLYTAGQWSELVRIHDQYTLSPYTYCCDLKGLKAWYGSAIEDGTISVKHEQQTSDPAGGVPPEPPGGNPLPPDP